MTLATEIATIWSGNSTDISNAVTEAADILSLYYDGGDLAEGTDTDWDKIIKFEALHILKMHQLQIQALSNPSIVIPSLIPKEVHQMIETLKTKALQDDTPQASIVVITSTPEGKYYSPANSRGSEI